MPLDLTESIALTPDHTVRLAAAAGSTPLECPDPTDEPGTRSVATNVIIRHVMDALRFYLEFHHAHDEGTSPTCTTRSRRWWRWIRHGCRPVPPGSRWN